jgi:hypothetical protein
MGLEPQGIELVVIGEQDVGWRLVQGLLIGDHAGGAHRRRGSVIGGADVEAGAQPGERRDGVDEIGDASLALGSLLAAVNQQGQKEAFDSGIVALVKRLRLATRSICASSPRSESPQPIVLPGRLNRPFRVVSSSHVARLNSAGGQRQRQA